MKIPVRCLIIVGIFFAFCANSQCQDKDKDLFERQKKAAEQGNAKAQLALACRYEQGNGVGKDSTEAVKWLRKAAEQGLAIAQYLLAGNLATGEGVPKDPVEAMKLYRKAAEGFVDAQCRADAQFNVALGFYHGEGVPKDLPEAVKWLRMAAEQGHEEAQGCLGGCYVRGEGIEKNPIEGVKWYRKAAEQGNAKAQGGLAAAYTVGQGVPKDDVEALAWWTVAAASGDEQYTKIRDTMEHNLGTKLSLQAQQRAKELFKEIEVRTHDKQAVQDQATRAEVWR